MSDIASTDLKAVTLPVPSEMRIFVFLASGRDEEVEARWLACGGLTTFLTGSPETCGVCLFREGVDLALLKPFFDRAGKESNIFRFNPAKKNFSRLSPEDFRVNLEYENVQ